MSTYSFHLLMLTFRCDYCGADYKESCRSKSGRKVKPHADRWWKAHRALDES